MVALQLQARSWLVPYAVTWLPLRLGAFSDQFRNGDFEGARKRLQLGGERPAAEIRLDPVDTHPRDPRTLSETGLRKTAQPPEVQDQVTDAHGRSCNNECNSQSRM